MSSPCNFDWTNRFWSLGTDFYLHVEMTALNNFRLAHLNESFLNELGLRRAELQSENFLSLCNGELKDATTQTIASVYSGHQFGVWAGQLGDGRAIFLGEQQALSGSFYEWQLKGSGQTPYSRMGDGRAVLRSSIREYLCSEAMYALGIPTTRALCLFGSDTPVRREQIESGAVVLRLSESFIRFGHFEHFFYRDDHANYKKLLDFVLANYYPEFENTTQGISNWFTEVIRRTAVLMAQWQAVGFNHGVMNTDNMSILGLTLDYGPFGFLDAYDPAHICNHSDHGGRYSFQNQPYIGQWNCAALGNTLTQILSAEDINTALQSYSSVFEDAFTQLMFAKLGLEKPTKEDYPLLQELFKLLRLDAVDYTQFFRCWSLTSLQEIPKAFSELFPTQADDFSAWCAGFSARLKSDEAGTYSNEQRSERLMKINPAIVLRNYWAQHVITHAEAGDFSELDRLLLALQSPFSPEADALDFASPPPQNAPKLCVSCSS